jgi:phosphoglycolate phosphatase
MGPDITLSASRTLKELGLSPDLQAGMERAYFDTYTGCAGALTVAVDGMIEFVRELAERGVPSALATMKAKTEFDAIGVPLPGVEYFDFIARPPRHLGGFSKTDLVGMAIEHIGEVWPDATSGVMIGDRASDIKAGAAHGLRTIAVTWGGGTAEELAEARPDETVSTVGELRDLLFGAVVPDRA